MTVTFNNSSNGASLHFENSNFLIEQVNQDALFQKRIKIISAIVIGILLIGGATTCGLGFATIIPYGLMHTVLVGSGAATATLSLYGIGAFYTGLDDPLVSYFTKLPVCHKLLDSTVISDEKSWAYLLKCREDYFSKCRETARNVLDTTLGIKELQELTFAYLE